MSELVTETSAMHVSRLAWRKVSSRNASPITTGRPSWRARGMPGALGLLSMQTTSKPRSCSWPVTLVPTLPSPTTMT